jgi:hypothetical protein
MFQEMYIAGFVKESSRFKVLITKRTNTAEETLSTFKQYIVQCGKPDIIRTDNGTEFVNALFKEFCTNNGILHELSAPYTPEQIGIVERTWGIVVPMARAMLYWSKLPVIFWPFAVRAANYVANRSATAALADENVTPYEKEKGAAPNIGDFRVFGSLAYAYIEKDQRDGKFAPVAKRVIYLGPAPNRQAHIVYVLESKRVVTVRTIKWREDVPAGNYLNLGAAENNNYNSVSTNLLDKGDIEIDEMDSGDQDIAQLEQEGQDENSNENNVPAANAGNVAPATNAQILRTGRISRPPKDFWRVLSQDESGVEHANIVDTKKQLRKLERLCCT